MSTRKLKRRNAGSLHPVVSLVARWREYARHHIEAAEDYKSRGPEFLIDFHEIRAGMYEKCALELEQLAGIEANDRTHAQRPRTETTNEGA